MKIKAFPIAHSKQGQCVIADRRGGIRPDAQLPGAHAYKLFTHLFLIHAHWHEIHPHTWVSFCLFYFLFFLRKMSVTVKMRDGANDKADETNYKIQSQYACIFFFLGTLSTLLNYKWSITPVNHPRLQWIQNFSFCCCFLIVKMFCRIVHPFFFTKTNTNNLCVNDTNDLCCNPAGKSSFI